MENHYKQLQNYKIPLGLILGENMSHSLLSSSYEKKPIMFGGSSSQSSFTKVIDDNVFNQLLNKVSSIHNQKRKQNKTKKTIRN